MQETVIKSLQSKFPSAKFEEFRGDHTMVIDGKDVREVITYLKNDPQTQLNMMMDLFGMDYLKSATEVPERFAVIYNLVNLLEKRRLIVKAFVSEDKPEVDSIHDLYKAANWFEREAWDLYGITFKGHPNLVRILCHNDFEGHALRKDYPSDRYQRLKTAIPSTGL